MASPVTLHAPSTLPNLRNEDLIGLPLHYSKAIEIKFTKFSTKLDPKTVENCNKRAPRDPFEITSHTTPAL